MPKELQADAEALQVQLIARYYGNEEPDGETIRRFLVDFQRRVRRETIQELLSKCLEVTRYMGRVWLLLEEHVLGNYQLAMLPDYTPPEYPPKQEPPHIDED